MTGTANNAVRGGYHEIECKLDAQDDAVLAAVQAWVLERPAVFCPPTRPDMLAGLAPAAMHGAFRPPLEVTGIRTRLYWDTVDLDGYNAGIEIRQQKRDKGGVRQTVKEGGNASIDDPVLDRMEHVSNLKTFGADIEAVKSGDARKALRRAFGHAELKPVICMISQRTRITYHPEGDPATEIEIGLDYPNWGFTFEGMSWRNPQLELELVKGPECHRAAAALLEREAARFESAFPLVRNVTSKPTPGFEHLGRVLATSAGRAAFAKLRAGDAWWCALGAAPQVRKMDIARMAMTG